jgi:hypothetical protein
LRPFSIERHDDSTNVSSAPGGAGSNKIGWCGHGIAEPVFTRN